MKAAIRVGSVNVLYNSEAVVRNSSFESNEVVLTDGWPAVLVVVILGADLVVSGLAFAWEAVEEVVIVVGCREGDAPVACWRSLPCSAMRAGPS